MKNGHLSHWLDSTRDLSRTRQRIEGSTQADVVIIGGGYTGLWTAYWTKKQDPSLDIVVLEKEFVGYGASGRNGGWISGKTVGLRRNLMSESVSAERVLEIERTCHHAVFEIDDLMAAAGKDIDAHRGGWMQIARSDSEFSRLRSHVEEDRSWGLTEDEIALLSAEETYDRIHVPGVQGAVYSPYSVKCNPAKLVYALAELCEDLGVKIYENSPVEEFSDGDCQTTRGHVRGSVVVLATEGYTSALPGRKRDQLPMVSSMVVTERIPESQWESIGWSGYECLSGAQHIYFYAQRTADNRIAIGGRGVPYFWGSRFDTSGELDPGTTSQLGEILQGLFPTVPIKLAHSWRGVLGVPRDWSPFIDYSKANRLVRVGGYAGQGVTASYVAGRTVAGLISEQDSSLTGSAWVRNMPRKWEAEPLRWIGSRSVQMMYKAADTIEHRRGGADTSVFGRLATKISGR